MPETADTTDDVDVIITPQIAPIVVNPCDEGRFSVLLAHIHIIYHKLICTGIFSPYTTACLLFFDNWITVGDYVVHTSH